MSFTKVGKIMCKACVRVSLYIYTHSNYFFIRHLSMGCPEVRVRSRSFSVSVFLGSAVTEKPV